VTENPDDLSAGGQDASPEARNGALSDSNALQIGFTCNLKVKPDERGRLKLPLEVKSFIELKYGKTFTAFHITSQDGESAEIYPLPEWHIRWAKIVNLPRNDSARDKLVNADTLYGGTVEMDPQGRLLIPEELQQDAQLSGEVKISGEGALLRVTSVQMLRQKVKSNPLTPQEKDSLAKRDL